MIAGYNRTLVFIFLIIPCIGSSLRKHAEPSEQIFGQWECVSMCDERIVKGILAVEFCRDSSATFVTNYDSIVQFSKIVIISDSAIIIDQGCTLHYKIDSARLTLWGCDIADRNQHFVKLKDNCEWNKRK